MSAPLRKPEQAVSAFNEGAQAFRDGIDDSANPYQSGTALAAAWIDGWDAEYARFLERNAA